MSDYDEKMHIVAFSTNDTNHSPNDILQILLDQYNHSILKKSRHAMSFNLVLPKEKKTTKIMLVSILDLTREYQGITDVNCYIIFIDLQSIQSKKTFDSIISFLKFHCNLIEKIYVLGIVNNKGDTNQIMNKKDIKQIMDSEKFDYKYIELNLEKTKDVAESLLNIFIKISKEKLVKDKNKSTNRAHLCNVF